VLRRTLLPLTAGIALYATGIPAAYAGPTCNVLESGKSLLDCIEEVDDGGVVIVPDGAILRTEPLEVFKSLTIRPATAERTFELVHDVPGRASPTWTDEHYPFNVDPLIRVSSGATVFLQDAELTPSFSNNVPNLQHSRAVEVERGPFTGTNLPMHGYRTLDAPSALQGVGFVARVSGSASTATFIDSSFNNFDARRHKGAVFYATNGGKLIIEGDTLLSGNRAGLGAAAYADGSASVTIRAAAGGDAPALSDNVTRSRGGALAASGGATIDITAGTFDGNAAGGLGGHVALDAATATVSGATFLRGSAFDGAGFYAEANASLTLSDGVRVADGAAIAMGGAISAVNSTVEVSESFLDNNEAGGGENGGVGGAIRVQGSSLTVRNSEITRNRASAGGSESFGGGIWATENTVMELSYNLILNNSAADGGALSVFGNAGTERVIGNLFCGNQADRGSVGQFYGTAGVTALQFTNNIVDGEGYTDGNEHIVVYERDYTIRHNTFLRFGDSPVMELGGGSYGEFSKNFIGFDGLQTAVTIHRGSEPSPMDSNAWHDANSTWSSPVEVDGVGSDGGENALYGEPLFTRLQSRPRFQTPCSEFDHALRGDSPLVQVDIDDGSLTLEQQQRGVIGALGSTTSRPLLWETDADMDGVLAMWDCDDGNAALGARYQQYYDADGDGVPGTQVEAYLCAPDERYSGDIEDCFDDDPSLTEPCDSDETDETDDTDVPDPGAEEIYWFGSGCTTSPSPAAWLWLALPLMLFRRRA